MIEKTHTARSIDDTASLPRTKLPTIVIIYLFCVVIPITFYVGPLMMTTLRVVAIFVVIPLAINLIAGKYGKIIITDILFFAHLAWISISLLSNNPDRMVEQVGSTGIEFLGGYLIGRAYIRSAENFAALCRALIILVISSLPLSIYEAESGRPLIVEYIREIPGFTSVSIITKEQRMGLERVQSTFAHPIHFGLFCSVAFSLAFVAMQGLVSDTKRYITSALVLFTGLLALSSGALLALVMQIGLIGWYLSLRNVPSRWWILVGLTAFGYVVIDILSNRTPLEVFMSYATFSAHNAYWRSIIFEWGFANIVGSVEKGIEGSPLFGIGLNSWIRPSYMYSGSMDNFWLVMGVRYGLPGFFTLAIGYILVIGGVMRRDFSESLVLTRFRRAWVFTFLGLTFTLCTVHVWTNIYSFVTFMFGSGVWLLTAEAPKSSERSENLESSNRRNTAFTRFAFSNEPDISEPMTHTRGTLPISNNRRVKQSP